jgi:hypothetical protein
MQKGDCWIRAGYDFDVPLAQISFPIRWAAALGVPFPQNGVTEEEVRVYAERLQAVLAEVQPSLHNCSVIGVKADWAEGFMLKILVIHPSLPRQEIGRKPTVIDMSEAVERYLSRKGTT